MKYIAQSTFVFFALALIALALPACKSRYPYVPEPDAKAHDRSTAPINFLHSKLKNYLGSDKMESERTDDGRIKVSVSLRNKRTKPLNVQVRCVFKDENGLSTGDETDWESLFFDPRQTLTYRAESTVRHATSYTVEVRMPKQK